MKKTVCWKKKAAGVLIAATLAVALAATAGTVLAEPGADQGKMNGKHKCGQQCNCAGHGQEDGGQKMGPEARLEKMKEQLGLTDDQAEKIKAIFQEAREEMKAAKEEAQNGEVSEDELEAKREAHRAAIEEKINAVLTPEQREKVEAFKASRLERGDRKGANAGKDKGQKDKTQMGKGQALEKLIAGLNLSDEQKVQAAEIVQRNMQEGQALRERMRSATDKADKEAARTLMKEHMERAKSELKAILTPDQQQALEDKLEEMRLLRDSGGQSGKGFMGNY